jgi:hypothetical protein
MISSQQLLGLRRTETHFDGTVLHLLLQLIISLSLSDESVLAYFDHDWRLASLIQSTLMETATEFRTMVQAEKVHLRVAGSGSSTTC